MKSCPTAGTFGFFALLGCGFISACRTTSSRLLVLHRWPAVRSRRPLGHITSAVVVAAVEWGREVAIIIGKGRRRGVG